MIKLFLIALATALATTETLNIIPPSHAFEITYDCANMIPSQCIEAKNILRKLGTKIAGKLTILRPITVKFSFKPLESSWEAAERGLTGRVLFNEVKTIGRAVTKNLAAKRDNGQLLMYPRAAIKQSTPLFGNSDVPGCDIELEFNSLVYWDFFNSPRLNYVDFEYYALKLLVRGLGVTSSLKAHRISRDEYFIAPRIHSTSKLTYFEPITAFDYYLEANGESIAEYASGISSFSSRPGLHTVEFITNFCSIPEMYNLGHYLTNLLKSDNLYARIPDYLTRSRGKIFPFNWALYNSSEDIDFYANGVELYQQQLPLLHDNRNSTLRLSEITANNGYDALLDRKTIKLLENIGYRTKNNSLPSRFAISSTFGSILYNPKDAKYVSDLDGEMLHGVFG